MANGPWQMPKQPERVIQIPCISDVVKQLLEIQLKHGDLPCFTINEEYGDGPTECVVAMNVEQSANGLGWLAGPWPRVEIK
jgi:hypothetical protein